MRLPPRVCLLCLYLLVSCAGDEKFEDTQVCPELPEAPVEGTYVVTKVVPGEPAELLGAVVMVDEATVVVEYTDSSGVAWRVSYAFVEE